METVVPAPKTLLHYPCLICLGCYTSRGSLTNHFISKHKNFFKRPVKCPACVRDDDEGRELFINKSTWELHVAREHPVHSWAACPCLAAPNVSLAPTTSVGRAKRVKVKEPDQELDIEADLPSPPQYCGILQATTTSSNHTIGHWESLSERSMESNSSHGDLDNMVSARRENAQSLTRDSGQQERKRKTMAAVEDIPIDPYLL
jgi:hypothetical protein